MDWWFRLPTTVRDLSQQLSPHYQIHFPSLLNTGPLPRHPYPTDKHTYLFPSSCHPPDTFRGIPCSQALRIRRIFSQPNEEESHLNALKTNLLKRQYNETTVNKQIAKAKRHDRSSLLTYKPKKKTDRVPLVTTYNPAFNKISNIIKQHSHLLEDNDHLENVFPSSPILAFRRPRNLRDLVVNAKLRPLAESEQPGCTKCNAGRSSVCPFISESTKFTSTSTGNLFRITTHIDCKSSWIAYLITCKKCHFQYVGKSINQLYTRFTSTKSDIKLQKKKNFLSLSTSILPIIPSMKFPLWASKSFTNKHDSILRNRESFWIAKLHTLQPYGINADP